MSIQKTTISGLSDHAGKTVSLSGWVYNTRASGKIAFVILRDGTGLCQCVVEKTDETEPFFDEAKKLTQESAVEITGVVNKDERSLGGYELRVTGHTILKVCLYCRGITIPFGSWLYVKKQDADKLGVKFATLTELAAQAVEQLPLPPTMPVTVLFDAYYLCATVTKAVENKGWHYIGVGKSNRRFTVDNRSHPLKKYGANVLRRSGKWLRITGLQQTNSYRVAERVGTMKKLGRVKVVFSRRRGDGKVVSLVTNDLKRSSKRVVGDYLRRWSIELLIKDEKQLLGLSAYRVLRYRAVVRHLRLVDCAHACLTHLGMDAQRAQGQRKNKNVLPTHSTKQCENSTARRATCAELRLPPIRQLKNDLRQAVWNEAVKDVVKVSHERTVIRRLEKLLAA